MDYSCPPWLAAYAPSSASCPSETATSWASPTGLPPPPPALAAGTPRAPGRVGTRMSAPTPPTRAKRTSPAPGSARRHVCRDPPPPPNATGILPTPRRAGGHISGAHPPLDASGQPPAPEDAGGHMCCTRPSPHITGIPTAKSAGGDICGGTAPPHAAGIPPARRGHYYSVTTAQPFFDVEPMGTLSKVLSPGSKLPATSGFYHMVQ